MSSWQHNLTLFRGHQGLKNGKLPSLIGVREGLTYFSSVLRGLTFKRRPATPEVANGREEIELSGMGVLAVISLRSENLSEGIWSIGMLLGGMES